ncbi:MAG TPA: hypothetical protein PKA31_02530 [Candidatus Moranbacteria bacterium]|nr:hypothetical protein [Candidatus Moranbacteria bacterium]
MNFLKGIMQIKPLGPADGGDAEIKPNKIVKLELKGTYAEAHGKVGGYGGEGKGSGDLMEVPQEDLRKMTAKVSKAFDDVLLPWDAKEKEEAQKILTKTKKRILAEGLKLEEGDESSLRTAVLEFFWDDFGKISDPDLKERLLEANEKVSLNVISDDENKKKTTSPRTAVAVSAPAPTPTPTPVLVSNPGNPEPRKNPSEAGKAGKDRENEAAFGQLRARIKKSFLRTYQEDPLEGRGAEDVLDEILNGFVETDDGKKSLEFFRKELANNPKNVGKLDRDLFWSLSNFVKKEFFKKVGASSAKKEGQAAVPDEQGAEQEPGAFVDSTTQQQEEVSGEVANASSQAEGEKERAKEETLRKFSKFMESRIGVYFVAEFSEYERKLRELVGEYPEEEQAALLEEIPELVKEKIKEKIVKHYAAKYAEDVARSGQDLAKAIYAQIAK